MAKKQQGVVNTPLQLMTMARLKCIVFMKM